MPINVGGVGQISVIKPGDTLSPAQRQAMLDMGQLSPTDEFVGGPGGNVKTGYTPPPTAPATPATPATPTPTAAAPVPTPGNSGVAIQKAVEATRQAKGAFANYFTAGGSRGLLGAGGGAGRSARLSLLGS